MNIREITFWIFAIVIGITSLILTTHMPLWLKMCIRVPEVYLLALFYKKFVKKDRMKTKLSKWRLKGYLHYIVILIGIGEFVYVLIQSRELDGQTDLASLLQVFQESSFLLILLVFLLILPFYYAFIQMLFYLRIFTVWVYNNKRKWFELSLIAEDIFLVLLFSLLV
jgi:magnesium-transporting ATPase (P-type)